MKWSNFKGSNSSLIVALGSKSLVNYLCINYELPLYTKEQRTVLLIISWINACVFLLQML